MASAIKFKNLVGQFGPAKALQPSDVDRANGTVRITRAWKRTCDRGGYEIGPPKTKKSVRTINIPRFWTSWDYSREWIFLNKAGRPVKGNGFHDRIWRPAVGRGVAVG